MESVQTIEIQIKRKLSVDRINDLWDYMGTEIKRIHWRLEKSVFFLITFGLRTLENSHYSVLLDASHLPQYISN